MYCIGRHAPVITALVFSTLFLVGGIYLAWIYNPAWLSRAGALIIIAGVLLGASRFYEWVQQKVADFVQANYDSFLDTALATIGVEKELLSKEDIERLRAAVKTGIHNDLTTIIVTDNQHLKKWELYLIVGGTFLNGFGEWLVSILKSYGV